ncbi:MAG: ABC transporter ATP-binding protein [Gammaproteobacteria bacterium]|jgi:putative ABC transport system ATP-binding protein|nr:ABC transporter ATP-binding protein [Gammaproteobacteria bacterium]MBU2277902.1 ABC transporter ATP-binding protein [Gammaproteobacteria bacterium]
MLELHQISKHYQPGGQLIEALKPISLTIKAGEYLAITGTSGSGKSTLMNILGLLDLPSRGDYLLDGVAISSMNDQQLSQIRSEKIGFVFQSFHLLNHKTALENVMLPQTFGTVPLSDIRQRATDLLQQVGLAERIQHKPAELSGGQRQRVAIARALMNQPKVLLADEPTGNLDSQTTLEVMALLEALNQQGQTLILVTHEPEIARRARRCLVLRDGEVVSDHLQRCTDPTQF